MKQILLFLMGVMLFSCTSRAQRQGSDTAVKNDSRVLVAYFSCTGHTKRVAEAVAQAVNGKLYRITPAVAYTDTDLDWRNEKSRSSEEMNNVKARPALGGEALNIKNYKVVFLGYPIWWNQCPRIINTFIEKYITAGIRVIPFATSGSSSITNSVNELRRLYQDITFSDGRLLNDGIGKAEEWGREEINRFIRNLE